LRVASRAARCEVYPAQAALASGLAQRRADRVIWGGPHILDGRETVSDRELPSRWGGGAPVLAGEVMGDWLELIGTCRPWSDMPLDDMSGEFRAVLEELLEPNGELALAPRASRLRRLSRAHGAFRGGRGGRARGGGEGAAWAQEAIEIALARSGAAPAVVMLIHDSLVEVLRSIERAAYSGYVDCSTDRPGRGS